MLMEWDILHKNILFSIIQESGRSVSKHITYIFEMQPEILIVISILNLNPVWTVLAQNIETNAINNNKVGIWGSRAVFFFSL